MPTPRALTRARDELLVQERSVMATKLHKEVRSVVGLRNELRRKDNIAIKLNAARLATLET